MIDTATWLENARLLYNTQQERRLLEKRESELSSLLRTLSHNEPLSYAGMRYSFDVRMGSIEYSAIPELKGVNLDSYRKPSLKVWKLSVETI